MANPSNEQNLFLMLGRQRLKRQEFRHADDRIQWRADLVAHQTLGQIAHVSVGAIEHSQVVSVRPINLEPGQFRIRLELAYLYMDHILDPLKKIQAIADPVEELPVMNVEPLEQELSKRPNQDRRRGACALGQHSDQGNHLTMTVAADARVGAA